MVFSAANASDSRSDAGAEAIARRLQCKIGPRVVSIPTLLFVSESLCYARYILDVKTQLVIS